MKYRAVIESTSTGYGGHLLDTEDLRLEALVTVGNTPEEVRRLLRECIAERISELSAEGIGISAQSITVEIADAELSEAVS